MTPDVSAGLATMQCPRCADTIPIGIYCGACGSHLADAGGDPLPRSHAYAAGLGEHVLHLTVVSSLFPHLPHRSRAPFRAALLLLVALLVVFAELRWQAALVAISALGFPLLFQLYLQESDVYEDLPVSRLLGGLALGGVLGWAWAYVTAGTVSDALGEGLLRGVDAHEAYVVGVFIPLGGLVLLLIPVAVLRLLASGDRGESLDGYLFGAIGALGFTVASTLTRLEPQLRTGLVARSRTSGSLLIEGLLQGGAVPLTAASIGGVVGATLWVRRRVSVHRGRLFTSPLLAGGVGAVLFVALGLVDVWQPSDAVLLGLHALGAAVALLVLRLGVHTVLLHEDHDVRIGPPTVCPHCDQVVPAMPFCPHCGAAARASSRTRRAASTLVDHPSDPTPGATS